MTTEIKEQQLSLNGITGAAHADDRPNSEMAGELTTLRPAKLPEGERK